MPSFSYYCWANYFNYERDQNWTKPFFCGRVCNTSWNIMSLLSDFMPLVSFYTPWKDQKTRDHRWYIERDQWHEMDYTFMTFSKHCKLGCKEKKFNTLTADYECNRSNMENLPLPIQMQLSKKTKTFCRVFIAFLESALNIEHFEKKLNLIA